jgi:hypothetical protein
MEMIKAPENTKTFLCNKCNFKCVKQSGYDRHILTAKHNLERLESIKAPKSAKLHNCFCGKTYKVYSGLWKHKKNCSLISNSIIIVENPKETPSTMDIITQNKEIMNMLVLQNKELKRHNEEQNKELKRQNKEQSDTIRVCWEWVLEDI